MKVALWGTRGSLASPGPETIKYGGNTSCVGVQGADGTLLVLDSGTGIRRLSQALPPGLKRVDILLTHLHMDHIQGLGFFGPLRSPDYEVHIWGPGSSTINLRTRLTRYLSPPLFPVHLRDLPCELVMHEVAGDKFPLGEFDITSDYVCHLDPTLGFRIESEQASLTYLPDHEPALGVDGFPSNPEWTSGHALAQGVDLLIHDAQYTEDEYAERIGWGHSTVGHAFDFAGQAQVRHLVPFHHDPNHNDAMLDGLISREIDTHHPHFAVTAGTEGATFTLDGR
jgi:ribonuclease BN (tRNA processing enzyme)